MAKLIKAVFGAGEMSKTCQQWQYDYNTILQFVGLDLPATFEVDLANSKTGQSETVLGDADGCCTIPAQYFIPGTSIFAWVYIVDSNSGYTRCQVEIPLHPRAQHTGDPPTPEQQSALDQAIALLNAATSNIPSEINAALEAAKESGEFDGKDGEDGSGVWYTTERISGDENPFISRRDLIGREGAAVKIHDLLLAPDVGCDGEPTTLYEITSVGTVCTLKRLCKMQGANGTDGASAYEIAVEHGYTGTEAEWLNSLHGADAVVDPTLSNHGEAADAAETGKVKHTADYALTFAETLNSGAGIPLDAEWERGGLNNYGANDSRKYRARTVGTVQASVAVTVKAASGYQFFAARYNPDGRRIGVTDWLTSRELPVGESWRICVRAYPENADATADPDVFGAAITIQNNIGSGGGSGENGATFTPSVSEAGVISWTNNKGLPNPAPVNIKGPQGPAYTLTAADKAEIVSAVLGEMTNAETEAL